MDTRLDQKANIEAVELLKKYIISLFTNVNNQSNNNTVAKDLVSCLSVGEQGRIFDKAHSKYASADIAAQLSTYIEGMNDQFLKLMEVFDAVGKQKKGYHPLLDVQNLTMLTSIYQTILKDLLVLFKDDNLWEELQVKDHRDRLSYMDRFTTAFLFAVALRYSTYLLELKTNNPSHINDINLMSKFIEFTKKSFNPLLGFDLGNPAYLQNKFTDISGIDGLIDQFFSYTVTSKINDLASKTYGTVFQPVRYLLSKDDKVRYNFLTKYFYEEILKQIKKQTNADALDNLLAAVHSLSIYKSNIKNDQLDPSKLHRLFKFSKDQMVSIHKEMNIQREKIKNIRKSLRESERRNSATKLNTHFGSPLVRQRSNSTGKLAEGNEAELLKNMIQNAGNRNSIDKQRENVFESSNEFSFSLLGSKATGANNNNNNSDNNNCNDDIGPSNAPGQF